jgi:hypothetical protein
VGSAPLATIETDPVGDPALLPPPVAEPPLGLTPEILPETGVAATDTVEPEREEGRGSILPWLLAGLLAAAAFLLLRRRRRVADDGYVEQSHHSLEQSHHEAHPEVIPPEPMQPASLAMAAAPVAAAPVAAAPVAGGHDRPWLELGLSPHRAGVSGDDAVVEFELIVGNTGSAPARDVRVSTWMLAAGETEMERRLIEREDEAELPEVTIEAGAGKRIEASVALPRAGLHDAILPVVVADARYRLPDGSEGRTSVSFAVGVPDGEELAHFDVEHPSGLHEAVEARQLGEGERV